MLCCFFNAHLQLLSFRLVRPILSLTSFILFTSRSSTSFASCSLILVFVIDFTQLVWTSPIYHIPKQPNSIYL